jgi:hypothetical protein
MPDSVGFVVKRTVLEERDQFTPVALPQLFTGIRGGLETGCMSKTDAS